MDDLKKLVESTNQKLNEWYWIPGGNTVYTYETPRDYYFDDTRVDDRAHDEAKRERIGYPFQAYFDQDIDGWHVYVRPVPTDDEDYD